MVKTPKTPGKQTLSRVRSMSGSAREMGKNEDEVKSEDSKARKRREASEKRQAELIKNSNLPVAVKMRQM